MADFPGRSPFAVVEAIKDIIKDKVVCDVGCFDGDLMVEMQKYAKEVIGIEIDAIRYSNALAKGLKIIHGNFLEIDIPEADIYYNFTQLEPVKGFIKRMEERGKGILVCGEYYGQLDDFLKDYDSKRIIVEHPETSDLHTCEGHFTLDIIDFNKNGGRRTG